MSGEGEIQDFGILTPDAAYYAQFHAVHEAVIRIEGKVDHLDNKVDHLIGELNDLARMVARTSDGLTMANVMNQILIAVNEIERKV